VPERWWRQATPIGELVVVVGPNGVSRIELPVSGATRAPEIDAPPERDDDVAGAIDAWFAGRRRELDVPVDLSSVASPFRRRVLDTVRRDVPWGETVTYGELAVMAGRPGAARADATTMATNPVPLVIPCHRVVAAGGRIGGYGGGLHGIATKRALLAREGTVFATR
jgi:methylated-DNA-[protein]-cysteine S-methyltransferase